jgi:hypothetical protein
MCKLWLKMKNFNHNLDISPFVKLATGKGKFLSQVTQVTCPVKLATESENLCSQVQ